LKKFNTRSWCKIIGVAAVTLLLLAGVSCGTVKNSPRLGPNAGMVEKLNLIAVPVGLNLDKFPGAESFSVKVYANNEANPKAVAIHQGSIEIVTFDGIFSTPTNLPAILKTWKFEGADLAAHEFKAHLGVGYEFTLSWGTNKPSHTLMSVAARYTSPEGRIVTSRPSSVTVIDK
jgi:hypothetical protein